MAWLIRILLSSICILTMQFKGHGFIADTMVDNFGTKLSTIRTVCQKVVCGKKQYVSSWDNASSWISSRVRAVGHAHINYTITIRLDDNNQHDIICSPSQSFYNIDTKSWVPAYRLQSGDVLLTQSGKSIRIYESILHKKPTTVYLLEVKKTHTFCVGHYRILTHNTPLACAVMLGISGSFGAGAAAGGTVGSFLGPITCVGGIVIGGLIGVGVGCLVNRGKIPHYHMIFDANKIESISYLFAKENAEVPNGVKTIEEIVKDCKPGEKTRGKSEQFEKDGGFEQAQRDFEELGAKNVRPIPNGKAGTLPDGRIVNVRSESSAKKPTLEVDDKTMNKKIKIRYNP